jgi:alpha-beta hydrolase superfamily lysophospholipase
LCGARGLPFIRLLYDCRTLNGETVSASAGIVYVLDGAGGSGWTPFIFRRSLSHLPYDVQHFRWGRGYMRILHDLTNRENVRDKAEELTDLIKKYKQQNPEGKTYIIAKSAGTLVALKALEQLEADSVERAILLSPAVSPTFPLSNALNAIRQDLISFWSPNDVFWLGLGTSLFGTADGVMSRAAGLVSFKIPNEPELQKQYSKLRQIKWEPSMMRLLHLGGHAGNSMPAFVRTHIIPLLTPDVR